ncbi:hypothetical protein SCALM49S_02702 [Streptomyces californicus]
MRPAGPTVWKRPERPAPTRPEPATAPEHLRHQSRYDAGALRRQSRHDAGAFGSAVSRATGPYDSRSRCPTYSPAAAPPGTANTALAS